MRVREMEVGFLGLGIMGKAMAINLLRHGFKVTVWNRTLSKVYTFIYMLLILLLVFVMICVCVCVLVMISLHNRLIVMVKIILCIFVLF